MTALQAILGTNRKHRKAALICIIVMAVFALIHWLSIQQVHWTMVSPLIPRSIIDEMTRELWVKVYVFSLIAAVSLAIFLVKRYQLSIITTVGGFLAFQLYDAIRTGDFTGLFLF